MLTTKITESDLASRKVASLPSRPTAPTAFGGKGYTSAQMKEAFDKLPLFLAEKFNSLLDDIEASGTGSLIASLPTGLAPGHTVRDFFLDVMSGDALSYLSDENGRTLDGLLNGIRTELDAIEEALDPICIDGGTADEQESRVLIRRDTLAAWEAENPVLTYGEIAVAYGNGGSCVIKIGDGTTPFCDLPGIGGGVRHGGSGALTVTPKHGDDLRLGELTSLALRIPSSFDEDFYSFLTFDSPNEPTVFSHSGGAVIFSGDDVLSGVFTPLAGKHYSLLVFYDGRMQCIVRGVEND